MRENKQEGKTVFVAYAHKDTALLKQLKKHLSVLNKQNLIEVWHDQDISAGTEWEREIQTRLNRADIILLLISPDFMASDYCYSVMERALERHEHGEAQVIPIILRPVDRQGAPFSKLQMLPKNAKAVTQWSNRDEAFLDVVNGIRTMIDPDGKVKKAASSELDPMKFQACKLTSPPVLHAPRAHHGP